LHQFESKGAFQIHYVENIGC